MYKHVNNLKNNSKDGEIMDMNSKLTKQIDETRYLTAENAWRYRTILRFFYLQYEKMKYWMYKEDVYEELKAHGEFKDYTIDLLKQDLDVLITWKNLVPVQDTSRVTTVEEFKNKQFRYRLSEYSVEIERMTIKLENLFVENASLEPSLLERIRAELEKFKFMTNQDEKVVGAWWRSLNDSFKRLNQNYQDYIGDFYSLRAEEMMKTREFLVYKEKFIDYLRDFIKGLQLNAGALEGVIMSITVEDEKRVLEKVFSYEKSIPRLDSEVPDYEVLDNINGKWESIKSWFTPSGGHESEASRLLDTTNEIIRKITRYAAQIAESRNSAANRKEEYKKIAGMFINCRDMNEAHKLSSLCFGIFNMRHVKINGERRTESINSGIYEEEPFEYFIKPRIRNYREKGIRNVIKSNDEKKTKMLEKVMEERQKEREILESYIVDSLIEFEKLPVIEEHVRNALLRWLTKGINSPDMSAKTEHGRPYRVIPPTSQNHKCKVECSDGTFIMPAYRIEFV